MSRADYLRGRRDERQSIIDWLTAEAADEPLPLYSIAYGGMAVSLRNVAITSEMFGLAVRPIPTEGEGE